MRPKVLLLGGTTEAFAVADALVATGDVDVTTSLAGRTASPRLPAGELRVGGFGGSDGLAKYLRDAGVDVLLDATHPFAAAMPFNAAAAAEAVGVPRSRLIRPEWEPKAGAQWERVPTLDAAAETLARMGAARVLLTSGRQELRPFAHLRETWFLIRCVDPPDPQPLAHASVLLARGPFHFEDELALLRDHRVDALVTKNSGGTAAAPKLEAARQLGIAVVIVDRPPPPPGVVVTTVADAVAWARSAAGLG